MLNALAKDVIDIADTVFFKQTLGRPGLDVLPDTNSQEQCNCRNSAACAFTRNLNLYSRHQCITSIGIVVSTRKPKLEFLSL